MISVEDREKIRRAYFKENKSQRQIARELGHSRKTVRKAIESAEPGSYTLRRPRPAPVLGPYKARIDELLEENERLPRKQRYTGHRIYEEIQADGYSGAESTVRGYIAQRRREKKKRKVYIPLEFDPGTDAQVDWGEAIAIVGGERALFVIRRQESRMQRHPYEWPSLAEHQWPNDGRELTRAEASGGVPIKAGVAAL